MNRQVVLDTETTGLEPGSGHRIVEIGCVEVINRRKGKTMHRYLNPEREVDEGAFEVHGLSNEFLADKPLFSEVAQELIDFIRDSEVIIHNAPFDVAFIDAEFSRLGKEWGNMGNYCRVLDTLVMAREMHPGQKNSLDALCARYEVDNSGRDLHGALLDAEILLDVYLAMTGGQTHLSLDEEEKKQGTMSESNYKLSAERPGLRVIKPSPAEMEAHRQRLETIESSSGKPSLWTLMEQGRTKN